MARISQLSNGNRKSKLPKNMAANFFQLLSASFTRIIFLVHGFVSVHLVVQSLKNSDYWWLCTGLVLLIFESFYTIIIRKGQEYKYFWPGSLLYMCTVLPVIWVAELNILDEKKRLNETVCELAAQSKVTRYTSIGPITLRNDSSGTGAQKWSKLGLILVIIIGRWLLPRGELTRDQLSALLLVYVANAADIMELFELFDDQPALWCKPGIAQAVLITYTWCFMQFTLVFTATATTVPDEARKKMNQAVQTVKDRDSRTNKRRGRDNTLPKYIKKLIQKKQEEDLEKFEKELNQVFGSPIEGTKRKGAYGKGRKKRRYSMHDTVQGVVEAQRERKIEEEVIEEVIKEKEKLRLHGDLYSILTMMLMQDGPFLVLRLIMIIEYGVTNETHLFFTGKNAMALSLLLYRMLVLLYEGKDEEKEEETDDFRPRPFAISYDRENTTYGPQ
ncbi:hypothetical protein QZH41_017631, partial [Actinostola sp. cb2023]